MSEARGGNGIVVDDVFPSANVLDGRDPLSGGGVCQHHLSVGISDAVDVGNDFAVFVFGKDLHFLVDGDESSLGLDAHVFESHVFGVGDASGGYHGGVDFESFDVLSEVSKKQWNDWE